MGNLFSKKSHRSSKQPAVTEQDRAILVNFKSKFSSFTLRFSFI